MDVAGHAEVGGVDDFVGGGVGEDGFGVDAGFVGEGAEAGYVVVEGDVYLGRGLVSDVIRGEWGLFWWKRWGIGGRQEGWKEGWKGKIPRLLGRRDLRGL